MQGQKDFKPKLFYSVSLAEFVPKDHELRDVLRVVDFGFIPKSVGDKYSHTGQPSIDPIVIIKMLFLGYFYGISGERPLVKRIQTDMAFRWFLGYDLDEAPPTHSVLSKARSRYGLELFQQLFDKVVEQCIKAGLVTGERAFVDATLIGANASIESLVPRLTVMKPGEYAEKIMSEEGKDVDAIPPDDSKPSGDDNSSRSDADIFNDRMVSKTDPNATYIARGKKSGLNYEGHYLVDGLHRIIVGVKTTDTKDNAGNYLPEILLKARFRHGLDFESVCADAEYGSQETFHFLCGQGITPYIPVATTGDNNKGCFKKEDFTYDRSQDVYLCPAKQPLQPKYIDLKKKQIQYRCDAKTCSGCQLKSRCTSSQSGRTVKRLIYEEDVECAKAVSQTREYKYNMGRRRVVVEPLFGEAKGQHGLERSFYRGLERVSIQTLFTATIQNIKRLIKAHKTTLMIKELSADYGNKIIRSLDNFASFLTQSAFSRLSVPNCQRTI